MGGMRITGLSGFDTESMVNKLMTAERMPYDKLKGKGQVLAWKQDLYRDMNKQLSAFNDMVKNMRFTSDWSKFTVSSSNDLAVSAANSSATSPGTHTVEVTSLAAGANLTGTPPIHAIANNLTGTADVTASITLSSAQSMVVSLGGVDKTITLNAGTYTDIKTSLQNQIDAAFGAGKVTAALGGPANKNLTLTPSGGANAPQLTVRANGADTSLLTTLGFANNQSYKIDTTMKISDIEARLGVAVSNIDLKINGVTIPTVSSTATLQDLINAVNNSSAGVKMGYDSSTESFSFITKDTGLNSKIDLAGSPSTGFLNAIGFGSGGSLPPFVTGKDAAFKIDGVSMTRNTNSFTIDGISYNLKQTTTAGSPVIIGVQRDTDAMFKKIKDFVDKYNETIDKVNSKLNEKTTYRKYPPLTDAQKKDMKDKDIELWETKAKEGLLRNDSFLSSTMQDLRLNMMNKVDNLTGASSLKQIGVIPSTDYRDRGKIIIDEGKLRQSLANNPDDVIAVFTAKSPITNQTDPNYNKQSGIAQRMYDRLNSVMDTIKLKIDNKGFDSSDNISLDKDIKTIDKNLAVMNKKLSEKENSYYKKFAAVEKALSQSQAQGSWLSAQLGQK